MLTKKNYLEFIFSIVLGSSTSSVGELKLEEFHRESIEAEIGFD
ncbi:hypothetical protein [Enterococcus sp. 1001283B150225_161107_E12]|nr:hypothetical protein [Enterococcus sp. 1001283B150225_161107_E12]